MGLLSRFTNKEGANKEASKEAEVPKAEVIEKKSATETGRERAQKVKEGLKNTWNKWGGGKAQEIGSWLFNKVADLGFAAEGTLEKGFDKGVEAYKAKQEAKNKLMWETRQEADEITESLSKWAEGASNELGAGVLNTIDSLNKWAQEKVDLYKETQAAAKRDVEAAKRNVDTGTLNLQIWMTEKSAEINQFITNVENAPQDFDNAIDNLKKEATLAIAERYRLLTEGAGRDYARAKEDVSSKIDTFRSWFNKKRDSLTGTAELKGEVTELKEQIAKQTRLIEQLITLQETEAESAQDDEDETDEVVTFNSKPASA